MMAFISVVKKGDEEHALEILLCIYIMLEVLKYVWCLMRGNGVENFVRNDKVSAAQIQVYVRICFESSPVGKSLKDKIFHMRLVSYVGAKNNICGKVTPAAACNLFPL